MEEQLQVKKHCPHCGNYDVYKAIVEDGGWGEWCPRCKRSVDAHIVGQCPKCGNRDVREVSIGGGNWRYWCPQCEWSKESIPVSRRVVKCEEIYYTRFSYMLDNPYRFEHSLDGTIRIIALRDYFSIKLLYMISFISLVILSMLMETHSKNIEDFYIIIDNLVSKGWHILFIIISAILFILFIIIHYTANYIFILINGQVFTFDIMSQSVFKNEQQIAAFDEVEQLRLVRYLRLYDIRGKIYMYALQLLIQNGRKIAICKMTDKQKIFTIAKDIANLLKISELIEKDLFSEYAERLGMGSNL